MPNNFLSRGAKAQQRKVFGTGLVLIAMFWIKCTTPDSLSIGKQEFDRFNSASIQGRVETIHSSKIGVAFRVNGKAFDFYPIADNRLVNDKPFVDLAEVGDSIKKAAYSDTLVLFTKNKAYSYTFKEY